MTTDHAVDIDKHVRIYISVFVTLMALTIWSMHDYPELTAVTHGAPPAHTAPAHHVP